MSIRVLIRSKGQGRALTLYYVDPDSGKEVTRSAGTKDKGEAERAAQRWEAELLLFRGKDGTGWDYARRRFEDEHLPTVRKNTRDAYATALNAFRRLVNVDHVSEITAGMISQFQAALLNETRPLTTIGSYLGHLRGFLRWLEFVGVISKAPAFKLPKIGKRKLMKGRPLTEAEHKKMLRACARFGKDAWEWRRLLELLWRSGLRIGEALELRWDALPVQVLLDASPFPQILFAMEGQKSGEDEACPMPPDLADWLEKTPRAQRRGFVINLNGKRGRRKTNRVGMSITDIGEAAGIRVTETKWASAHDYRRAFGTRWATKVRPVTLQRMMRHSAIETTLRYYVGLSADDAGAELWSGRVSRKVSRNRGQKQRKAE